MRKLIIIYRKDDLTHIVYEDGHKTITYQSIREYLNYLALCYGSTLDGRLEAFEFYTGIRYKKGIIISNESKIYLIATKALDNKDIILFDYSSIKRCQKINKDKTLITFNNGLKSIVDIDIRVLKKQMKNMDKYIESYSDDLSKVL